MQIQLYNMKSYTAFKKKYKTCQSETEQLALLKDFMFSLSPDELFTWMNEGTEIIYKSLSELLKTGNPEDLKYVKNYIHSLEKIMKKEPLLSKAA